MSREMVLQTAPHLPVEDSTPKVMFSVIFALIPALLAATYFFGYRALLVVTTCVLSAVVTELVFLYLRGKKLVLSDGSAILTGLLLGLTLPVRIHLSLAALGSIIAIALGKQIFGGLGHNIFNPALVGRAFLQASYPVLMTTWIAPLEHWTDNALAATTTATPLAETVEAGYRELFLGNIGGSLGETSALALLAGGLFLILLGNIDWRIPLSFLTSTAVVGGLLHLYNPGHPDPLTHLLSGGLMLGAFFMATDMVTTPITSIGSWIFGLGCGTLVVIIRLFGGQPGGVMYAILLMNAFTPIIDRYTRPSPFGEEGN